MSASANNGHREYHAISTQPASLKQSDIDQSVAPLIFIRFFMNEAFPMHEVLDSVSRFIAAPGSLILTLAAAVIVAVLIFEVAYMARTFRALIRLT